MSDSGLATPRTTVVHCRRSRYDVYIGRPSVLGNPFRITTEASREECIARYARWAVDQPWLLAMIGDLVGKTLGCWCSPLPCHGDVLAWLANTEVPVKPAVYVDNFRVRARVGRTNARWSHLTADTRSGLHCFAQRIGLRRAWFQDKPHGKWHYDVTDSRRLAAIDAGATPVSWHEMGEIISRPDREGRRPEDLANCPCGSAHQLISLPAL